MEEKMSAFKWKCQQLNETESREQCVWHLVLETCADDESQNTPAKWVTITWPPHTGRGCLCVCICVQAAPGEVSVEGTIHPEWKMSYLFTSLLIEVKPSTNREEASGDSGSILFHSSFLLRKTQKTLVKHWHLGGYLASWLILLHLYLGICSQQSHVVGYFNAVFTLHCLFMENLFEITDNYWRGVTTLK